MHVTANDLLIVHGAGALCLIAVSIFKEKSLEFGITKPPSGLVISGLRALGEAVQIKSLHGVVMFVDAPPLLRYEWMSSGARQGGGIIILLDKFGKQLAVSMRMYDMQNYRFYLGETDVTVEGQGWHFVPGKEPDRLHASKRSSGLLIPQVRFDLEHGYHYGIIQL